MEPKEKQCPICKAWFIQIRTNQIVCFGDNCRAEYKKLKLIVSNKKHRAYKRDWQDYKRKNGIPPPNKSTPPKCSACTRVLWNHEKDKCDKCKAKEAKAHGLAIPSPYITCFNCSFQIKKTDYKCRFCEMVVDVKRCLEFEKKQNKSYRDIFVENTLKQGKNPKYEWRKQQNSWKRQSLETLSLEELGDEEKKAAL